MKKGPAYNCQEKGCNGKPKKVEKFAEDSQFIGTFCSKCMKTVDWDMKEKAYVEANRGLLETLDQLDEEQGIKKVEKKKPEPKKKEEKKPNQQGNLFGEEI